MIFPPEDDDEIDIPSSEEIDPFLFAGLVQFLERLSPNMDESLD